eukprot:2328844-Amphidinium_carterae.1
MLQTQAVAGVNPANFGLEIVCIGNHLGSLSLVVLLLPCCKQEECVQLSMSGIWIVPTFPCAQFHTVLSFQGQELSLNETGHASMEFNKC